MSCGTDAEKVGLEGKCKFEARQNFSGHHRRSCGCPGGPLPLPSLCRAEPASAQALDKLSKTFSHPDVPASPPPRLVLLTVRTLPQLLLAPCVTEKTAGFSEVGRATQVPWPPDRPSPGDHSLGLGLETLCPGG